MTPADCSDCGKRWGSVESMRPCSHASGLHSWTQNRPADFMDTVGRTARSLSAPGQPIELHLRGHRFVLTGGSLALGFPDGFGIVTHEGIPQGTGLDQFIGDRILGTTHPGLVLIVTGPVAGAVLNVLRSVPEGTER